MEEAKKNMYAFSTTTYTGFQCTVSEETSEKFKGEFKLFLFQHMRCWTSRLLVFTCSFLYLDIHLVGLPGVLWVLPDSYIDVKNKDYGG